MRGRGGSEEVHACLGAAEVLLGECEHGERADAPGMGAPYRVLQRTTASLVALRRQHPPRLRPSPVPVHHHRHVPRQRLRPDPALDQRRLSRSRRSDDGARAGVQSAGRVARAETASSNRQKARQHRAWELWFSRSGSADLLVVLVSASLSRSVIQGKGDTPEDSLLGKCRPCLVSKIFQDSPSHRILWQMHEVLNIDENKN